MSIDATEITLSWPMATAGTGGGNPPTGYQVYMFPGVAINTLASPVTVFKDVQVVATTVNTGQVPHALTPTLTLTLSIAVTDVEVVATADMYRTHARCSPA